MPEKKHARKKGKGAPEKRARKEMFYAKSEYHKQKHCQDD
jgi:hypothetical protein